MKILIVGKNSYIGNHIDQWLSERKCEVSQLDALLDGWQNYDYSGYDAIVHVAGIVHQPQCRDWELYRRVNAEMPVEIAKRAKRCGVKKYIFLSTMGVYGAEKKLIPNVIDANTHLTPHGMYGKSKWMAEEGLRKLQDGNFNVVCVRPPSVYGKGCRGGYISGFASIVVPVEHAGHAVEAEAVQVVFRHPVLAVGQEEVPGLVLAIVEAAGAPGGMPALGAFVEIQVLAVLGLCCASSQFHAHHKKSIWRDSIRPRPINNL